MKLSKSDCFTGRAHVDSDETCTCKVQRPELRLQVPRRKSLLYAGRIYGSQHTPKSFEKKVCFFFVVLMFSNFCIQLILLQILVAVSAPVRLVDVLDGVLRGVVLRRFVLPLQSVLCPHKNRSCSFCGFGKKHKRQ